MTQQAPSTIKCAIEFENACVTRTQRTIWSHASFRIPEQSVTAIVGTNGTGKTTMLQVELGLLALSQGNVRVLGKPAGTLNHRIGYVPQGYASDNHASISAQESVLLGLVGTRFGIHRVSKAHKERVEHVMELTGVADVAHERLSHLSGGLRQRVAIAQALACEPQLLLLDEPLANLDLPSQKSMVQILRTLNEQLSVSIQVVAHDLNMLLPILTGAVYLLDGRAQYTPISHMLNETLLTSLYGTKMRIATTAQGDTFVTPMIGDKPVDVGNGV